MQPHHKNGHWFARQSNLGQKSQFLWKCNIFSKNIWEGAVRGAGREAAAALLGQCPVPRPYSVGLVSNSASPRTSCETDFPSLYCLVVSVCVRGIFPNECPNLSSMQLACFFLP